MIRNNNLPDPPLNDVLTAIEDTIKWDFGHGAAPKTPVTTAMLYEGENRMNAELHDHVLKLIDTRSYKDDNKTTENMVKLSIRRANDVGKFITGACAALQSRDKTRRLVKNA